MHPAIATYFYTSVGYHIANNLYNFTLDFPVILAKTEADREKAQQNAISYYSTRSEKKIYFPMIFCIGLITGVTANAISEFNTSPVSSILAVALIPIGIGINTKYSAVPGTKLKEMASLSSGGENAGLNGQGSEVEAIALIDLMRIGHMASIVYIPLMLACVAINF